MIKEVKRWLVIAFLLLTVVFLVWFKFTQARVLVIQSYNPDYAWTRDVDLGLHRVLNKQHYRTQWYYMDTKKHPDPGFKHRAGQLAIHEIESFKPDVIIAIDDDAQKFAVMKYAGDPDVKIIFAGINGSVEPYGYVGAPNVTGIYERIPINGLYDALKALRYDNKPFAGRRFTLIGDRSDTVMTDSRGIEAKDWSPYKLVHSLHAGTFDEWKSSVARAEAESDFILISNYQNVARSDKAGQLVPPREVLEWTEKNSKIPVIGTGGWMVEDGGMLAFGSSGFEQGEVSAGMCVDILNNGTSPQAISFAMPRQYLVYMRESTMHKRKISLPDVYEAFSRATNNYK